MKIVSGTASLISLLAGPLMAWAAEGNGGTPAVAPRPATPFYVATDGNDRDPGSMDKPFATLARARDAVRGLKAKGLAAPVEVIIRGGVYDLSAPLVLTPEDSGTEKCPITWRAQQGERVVLRGGQRVTGWKPWRGGVYVTDLKTQGLAGASFHELFYKNDKRPAKETPGFAERQILARHPNFDPQHPRTGGNVYVARKGAKPKEQVVYAEGDLPFDKWKDISQAEAVSTYNRGWQFAITPIRSVDPKTQTITVRPVRGEFIKLNRFFIQNVLDALDAPGEWYLDSKTSLLYFFPPDADIESVEVIAPIIDNIVEVRGTIPYPYGYLNVAYKGPREEYKPSAKDPKGAEALQAPMHPVEHLVFRGIDFECARQDALRLTGARACQVIACRATNVGGVGFNLGGVAPFHEEVGSPRVTPAAGHQAGAGGGGQIQLLNDPCVQCRVTGCDAWATGLEGIMLFGTGNAAENNHVYDIALYDKDAAAICLLGEENAARRNTLHDCPRCAVFLKGVDNVVELNDVHHACLETCDMGGIRMVQRNVFLTGNRIRFNKVIDVPGYGFRWQEGTHFESPYYTWGVYLDDYTCGTEIFGNIISRATRGGVMLHGGGHNVVANNLIVNAGSYQVQFQPMPETNPSYKNAYANNRVERNVLVCSAKDSVPYCFTSRVKDPLTIAKNVVSAGSNDVVVLMPGQVAVRGWKAWLEMGIDQDSIVADPLLTDPAKDEFLPRPQSPVWKMGFQPIPVEQIGCYQSPDRAAWPIRPDRERFREKPVLHAVAGYDSTSEVKPRVAPGGPVREDFESDPVGQPPARGDVAAPKPSAIVVTDEIAATGKQCLKFVDAPGLPQSWQPRIYYPVAFVPGGNVTFSCDLRIDGKRPASLYIDPRQYSKPGRDRREYISGPMLTITDKGELMAGKKVLARIPFDRWFHVELQMKLGQKATDRSSLTLTVQGEAPRQFQVPHAGQGFQHLERVVIASLANAKTIFYLDNVAI